VTRRGESEGEEGVSGLGRGTKGREREKERAVRKGTGEEGEEHGLGWSVGGVR
jgi:hypothetical protein